MADASVGCRIECSSEDGRLVVDVSGWFDEDVSQAELLLRAIDALIDAAGGRWRPDEDNSQQLLDLLRDAWIHGTSWVTGFEADVMGDVLAGEVREASGRLLSSDGGIDSE